ncbi:hypothetical protein GCM10010317_015860 [Streptomyces mirabilis]|nr:hypothetical protein GCM10010317_015860 [Streptomyces mirabilis]
MDHGDPAVEGSQGTGERGRSVPLDQHRVRALAPQQGAQPVEDAHGDVGEGLAFAEDVQVVVGVDAEQRLYLVEQAAVLCGHCHRRPEHQGPAERFDDGGHFDGFRSRSVDHHQSLQSSLLLSDTGRSRSPIGGRYSLELNERAPGTSESVLRGNARHAGVVFTRS